MGLHDVKKAAQLDALTAFGVVKEAAVGQKAVDAAKWLFRSHEVPMNATTALGTAKQMGLFAGEVGRDFIFGSPVNVAQELSKKGLGKFMRDAFIQKPGVDPKTLGAYLWADKVPNWRRPLHHVWNYHPISHAISLGLPAMSVYDAMKNPDPRMRNADVASAATGIALTPFTGRLGLAGNFLQGAAMRGVHGLVAPRQDPTPNPVRFRPATQLAQSVRNVSVENGVTDQLKAP